MRARQSIASLVLVLLVVAGCGSGPQDLPATGQPAPTAPAEATPLPPQQAGVDTFFEDSFHQFMLRNPELLTQLGLTETFGVGNDRLTDISDAYLRETQNLEVATLAKLREYDRASLTPEQQLSYDIYEWYLDDLVRSHEFMYNDYPVTHFVTGVQNQLIQFFGDVHPVRSLQDAQDYVTRLSQVDEKLDQLLDGLARREEAGVVLPRFLVGWVLGGLQSVAQSQPRATPFYTSFEEKLGALSGVGDADKQALLQAAEKEIEESVLPAFQSLVGAFTRLQTVAPDEVGVSRFGNGEEYYAYTLRHHTTTDLTAEQIHALGLQEVARVQAEMRAAFDDLGYPQDQSLSQLFGRVVAESGLVSGEQVARGYEELIQDAEARVSAAFDLRPKALVRVVGGPEGDYYLEPAVDGSRPGIFYALVTGSEPRFAMPTLAYHEAVPGHHFQLAIQQELDLATFRKGVTFTAFVEGWALYAERLAWELGFYQGDPYGNVGRLQAEAFRAARLVVDTGIHAKGWTYQQGVDYMLENTGIPRQRLEFEVGRYIAWPGQACSYQIGMLKILELRQRAQDRLGDEFDLKEFHGLLLGSGSLPLEVLERVVDGYIEEKLAQ